MKREIARIIHKSKTVCICSHIMPDADSIGSGLALSRILKKIGKDVKFYNIHKAPFPTKKLPGYETIEYKQIFPNKFDIVILIEGGDEKRTGQKKLSEYYTINIDHHSTSSRNSNLNWIVPEAAAVAELIYELVLELKVDIDDEIGFNLYAAIVSDTGSFKYSNTTAKTLKIASNILEKSKINPYDVSWLLFNTNKIEKIKIFQKIMATLKVYFDKQVSVIEYKKDFLDGFDLKDIETEDIISMARSIIGIRVTLFFKEIQNNKYRISIRSKGCISAQKIAKHFQGGGHDHAAGFYYNGDLEDGKKDVLKVIKQHLENDSRIDCNK